MKVQLIVALGIASQIAMAQKTGVSWSTIDPFCGQVTSAEPQAYPIKSGKFELYRATAKHLPCCGSAKSLGNVRIDQNGNFDLRNVSPGQYWLVARWGETAVPIALWYEGKHHPECDERFKNVIEIRPSNKTAERTIVSSNDTLTNAKTN